MCDGSPLAAARGWMRRSRGVATDEPLKPDVKNQNTVIGKAPAV